MGRRGPVPMPANVRELRGRTSHSKPPQQAVKARPACPAPPSWLDREARAEWNRVVPDLDRLGVLAKVDRGALATYCSAWSRFKEAEQLLQAEGITHVRANDGVRAKHPAWQIWREAATTTSALAKELYLTPAARLRAVRPEGSDDDDQEEGIFD